jgi:membrane protein DedA with SNARE-associated domain
VTGLVDHILNAPAWAVLGLVGLVVLAEDALFVGFVIPGETAALLGGVAASRGHVSVLASPRRSPSATSSPAWW